MSELSDPEDLKLHTLAKGARGRVQANSGAAVRDDTGRTYASANVALPHLELSAISAAIAQAAASGARGVEAVVLISETSDLAPADVAVVRDLGGVNVPIYVCGLTSEIRQTVTT